ncbi:MULTISPECIES: helix-turn-helix transcriptional regulator [unclassified Streptomyces]|uniref:helix-turn-helix domain-containing protein n=1 Tax=unclassified Streptomyces TaxID=2593676 RepID=UPI00110FE608|nr:MULTISPECIES: helix-turn-helix transcriptional regulator [unclassified Streptomyces]MCG0284628.1 helix-turn-helix transcriptional regulator [Streptomyces sp. PSAA01]TMU92369.1 helix-turn-helix domain-containing protein [Streptomyces sp. DASNCL29]
MRSAPTERQQRLGAELRKLRLAAGASTQYAAGLLGLDRAKISNMEAGTRITSPERVRTLASNYDCSDGMYIDALAAMADETQPGWWEQYRGTLPSGLLDIAELEWHAKRLLTGQIVHLPGLLHTEEYARAVFDSGLPRMSRLEVELRVKHRLDRQQVLEEPISLPYIGYIHEAALRMQFGGRKVTRTQLDHLQVMSERDNITLRIIPASCAGFPGAGHALLYAEGPVPQLDTVQLDSTHGPEFLHADAQLAKFRAHLDWMDEHSLSPEESRELIHTGAREL